MTTQTFETSKGTLMAIRMEDDDKVLPDRIEGVYRSTSVYGEKIGRQKVFYFPKGFKEIGLWGSVSEEKAKEVVDVESVGLYVDYTAASDFGKKRRFDTALESLQSLLQTKIPLTHDFPEPKPEDYFNTETPIDQFSEADKKGFDEFSSDLMRWESGEGKVWKHFYLIFKTK